MLSMKCYPVLNFFGGVVLRAKQAEDQSVNKTWLSHIVLIFLLTVSSSFFPFFWWCSGLPVHDHNIPTYNKIWRNFWSYFIKWSRWDPGCILRGLFALFIFFFWSVISHRWGKPCTVQCQARRQLLRICAAVTTCRTFHHWVSSWLKTVHFGYLLLEFCCFTGLFSGSSTLVYNSFSLWDMSSVTNESA